MPVATTDVVVDLVGPHGHWVDVGIEADGGGARRRITGRAGTTGNRLDPSRRALRWSWEVSLAERVEVTTTWPVREIVTHRIGAFVADVADAVAAAGGDPATLETVARVVDPSASSLADALWARSHPLLGPALDAGAAPHEVPLPLEGVLRSETPRRAADRLVGRRVTRPLIRMLATSLVPTDGIVSFEPLLAARMAAPTCGPEQVTSLLEGRPARPGALAVGVADVDRAATMFLEWRPRRVVTRLRRAIEDDGGMAELLTEVWDWAPAPPPGRPTPNPRAPAQPTRPRTRTSDPGQERIDYPPTWLAARGAPVGALHVVLPGRGNDLVAWGRELDNCLGGFRLAAATGRTRLIGLAGAGNRLHYVVEVTPGGTVRQLEGPRNQRPAPGTARDILLRLAELGLVVADRRSSHPLGPPRR